MNVCRALGALLAGTTVAWLLGAEPALTLAPLFQDGAVLQRDRVVPVWGAAAPGETVAVEFGDQVVRAVAGADGRWQAHLEPMPAAAQPRDLRVVAPTGERVVRDVVVGEVWLASGQSNMEWPLRYSADRDMEIPAARWPLIREFKVARQAAAEPRAEAAGAWRAATPEHVAQFSGVAYAFARDLHLVLDVPVGIVNSTYGGTPIEAWLPPEAVGPTWGGGEDGAHAPAALYHGMIHPVVPYALRGFIWYQGEANANRHRARHYAPLFEALILGWRARFQQPEAPFYWAQLSAFRRADLEPYEWARLREAQTQVLALPQTGQAITLDVGDLGDIHPKDKATVGRRLARLALRRTYGFDVLDSGPVVASVAREGAGYRVRFDQATGGLRARTGEIRGFELAGPDRVFHPAEARADGDNVLVTSAAVTEPAALRYAWRNDPDATLINRPGLPAAPFRTDDW